jgi:colicin import membrane protein
MLELLRDHPSALAVAAGLHLLLALFLVVGIKFSNRPVAPAFTPVDIVEAIAIDGREFDQARRQRELEDQRQRQAALESKQKAAAEKKRQAELKRQREEQVRQKAEAEKQRQVELKRQREEQARQKAEAEKKRQAELERKQREEAERQRIAQQKAEEERRRAEEQAAEQRLREQQMAEEEARIAAQLEAEQARLAAIEAEKKAEEERRRAAALQRELARYRNDYVNAITAAIDSKWLRPPGERQGQSAVILVDQGPGGIVLNVRIKRCIGSEPFCRSVVTAVQKADPLPPPPRPEVFERQLEITFEPDKL